MVEVKTRTSTGDVRAYVFETGCYIAYLEGGIVVVCEEDGKTIGWFNSSDFFMAQLTPPELIDAAP